MSPGKFTPKGKKHGGCASRGMQRRLAKALGQRLRQSGHSAKMTGDRAKSKHSTSTNSYGAVGLVYLGAANNQGFAIMALFPPDGGDGFMPEANAIFSEIQVKPRR